MTKNNANLVIADECTHVCKNCHNCLSRNIIPKNALYNGLWLGKVPDVLCDLTWGEKFLIARARVNNFLVRVSSGMHKMKANVVAF